MVLQTHTFDLWNWPCCPRFHTCLCLEKILRDWLAPVSGNHGLGVARGEPCTRQVLSKCLVCLLQSLEMTWFRDQECCSPGPTPHKHPASRTTAVGAQILMTRGPTGPAHGCTARLTWDRLKRQPHRSQVPTQRTLPRYKPQLRAACRMNFPRTVGLEGEQTGRPQLPRRHRAPGWDPGTLSQAHEKKSPWYICTKDPNFINPDSEFKFKTKNIRPSQIYT